jgi:signal transduction histidine kinase
VRVSVQDNGPGIPADQLPEIFEPFYTVKERGMGVGLPICRLIVEHHGGSIHVEKAENGGALFYFDLRGGLKTDEGSNKL